MLLTLLAWLRARSGGRKDEHAKGRILCLLQWISKCLNTFSFVSSLILQSRTAPLLFTGSCMSVLKRTQLVILWFALI